MIVEFGLFFLGILGLLVFYTVLARLSVRMGEGMGISKYYILYYFSILALILTIPEGWSVHYAGNRDSGGTLFALLIIGNAIAIAASFKYWWWLKDELLGKQEKER
ncbi:MAG: hypothetical protein OIN66_08765 [Candidatus Methanoperedens sp.]|nr:hypothetical protein [Candidatus Methanoperedens sp.]